MPNWPQWGGRKPDWRDHPEERRLSAREIDNLKYDSDLTQAMFGRMFRRLQVLPVDAIFDGTLLKGEEP